MMPEVAHWRTPIQEGCYMVGERHADSLLQCNTYLRTFRVKGHALLHWCVDPGSQIDYPAIRKHLREHVGEIAAIRLFSINHQDPDVVENLPFFTKENPDMEGLTTQDTWRLVRHLNVHPKKMFFAKGGGQNTVSLPTGHHIICVPTPFCHFRGAVAYYDPESQVLFTGDLFAGLNKPGRTQLYAEEEDWPGIAQFHQIYMPNRTAVAFAIRQIRALRPAVKVIAPQHGFLLQGDFMHVVMDRLQKLRVGMDLLPKELDEQYLKAYTDVGREVITFASGQLGRDTVIDRLRKLPKTHDLNRYIKLNRNEVQLIRHGIIALPLLVDELTAGRPYGFTTSLKSVALEGCIRHKAPLPQLGIGLGEGQ